MIALFDSSRLNIGDLLYDDIPVGLLPVGYRLVLPMKVGHMNRPRGSVAPAAYYIEIAGGFD